MTSAELKAEIESGPLAALMTEAWGWTRPVEPEPPAVDRPGLRPVAPDDRVPVSDPAWVIYAEQLSDWNAANEPYQARQRWERLQSQFGKLYPDAAAQIADVLNDKTKRTRLVPIGVLSFAKIIVGLGLRRKISKGKDHPSEAVASICYFIEDMLAGAIDRTVDPSDPATIAMIDAMVAAEIATAEDKQAFLASCSTPCSRAEELGWPRITVDHVIQAKSS